ncbi:MAG: PIN domain-containing protein [Leptospiraceae bacterium]|nr:PIN domain-containing protein [Leptospiraceae bacterium]
MSKIFLDTNILVYSLDNSDKKKQKKSRSVLSDLAKSNLGVISTQVLQEFYVVCTKKLKIEPLVARDILNSFAFETVVVTQELIHRGIDYSVLYKLSFWDALILAAAENAKCSHLWSEDFPTGQVIRNLKIENPLKEV